MNRFEALHALGLEEGATESDVKLSLYGLEKAVKRFDFTDIEALQRKVDGFVEHARESKKFLLNPRNQSAARQVQSYTRKDSGKVSVTAVEDKVARLGGLERLRRVVCAYLGSQQELRRNSILLLLGCIVFGFIALRYIRIMMARIAAFTVLAIVAVVGSTMLTQAIVACRKTKAHILEMDETIKPLKAELGLDGSQDADADSVDTDDETADGDAEGVEFDGEEER